MGGLVDSIFGGGGSDIETYSPWEIMSTYPSAYNKITGGLDIGTGYSSLNADTGGISIDPTGRKLNLGGLAEYRTNLGGIRQSLLGNQGAYMQARVNPLLEQLARGRGELNREVARTGVRGTFRNRALEDYDIAGERAAGDARALATNETLKGLAALDNMLFEGMTGVGTNIFNQELASLGLSAETINNLRAIAANLTTGSASSAISSQATAATADQARAENISGAIGSGLAAYGMIASSKDFKDDHGVVTHSILDKLLDLDMHEWNYKGEDKTHYGPWSEDFNAIIGKDSQYIELVDVMGVMLMATKELIQEVRDAKSG